MQKLVSILFLCLFVGSSFSAFHDAELGEHTSREASARATGVDVTVTDISFSYTTAGDEEQYRMFSSNYPVIGFNRPAELYIVDAVVNVPIQVDIIVENLGTSNSGTIDVNIKVLHNEYSLFEMVNETVLMNSLNGGNSDTVSQVFTPTYSGNHTLVIRSTSSLLDDNAQNDENVGSFTVASQYLNCDELIGWSAGMQWGLSTDTALSMGSSCHVGNGQSSTYSNNLVTALVTPVMDMSDAVSNPTRTNGLGFYYTGSVVAGDVLKIEVLSAMGGWYQLGSISNSIDQNFVDGQDYQTFSVTHAGATSPLLPVPQEYFHSQTQFRFLFESDASETDIGYFLDELVFVYDQKVRPEEYSLSSNGVSTVGSVPGQWGNVRVEVTNDGNISDSVLPEISGLPAGWNIYFANPSGVSINSEIGVLLAPGESKFIDIKIKPDGNATTGLQQMVFRGVSSQYDTINTTLAMQFQVVPDREPYVVKPELTPSCPPGNTCPISIEVRNLGDATDVFDLVIDSSTLPNGWGVQFAWTQDSSILVRTDTPVYVDLTMTIPQDAIPDSMFTFSLTANSQNNSIRTHTQPIDVAASMVSNAAIGISEAQLQNDLMVDAGETISIEFTIWNNATRQDIFSIEILHDAPGQWIIEQPNMDNAVINGESHTSFSIDVTSPVNGQAGDVAPTITPVVLSKRSGMEFQGIPVDGITVNTVSDLELRLLEAPQKLTPGLASKLSLEIENNGNGAVSATLESDSIPSSWEWWMKIDESNHTGVVELTAPYDNEDIQMVEVWILLPSAEKAGEIHTIEFTVSNGDGLTDLEPLDNTITFDSITASVRIPSMDWDMTETTASVGDTASVNVTVKNIGNAVDEHFMVMSSISTSPPHDGVMAFLSIGTSGASRPLDILNPFRMNAGQEMIIVVDIIIPEDMPLNTRIVVKFDVIAGEDVESRPYELKHEIMILIDKQRVMDAEMSQQSTQTYTTGIPAPFWINVTSTSTQPEQYLILVQQPEQWQTICQGVLVNSDGQTLQHEAGHLIPKYTDMMCEIHRLGGDSEGTVTVTIESTDGEMSWSDSRSFTFSEQDSDGMQMNVEIIASTIASVLFLAVILALVLRKKNPAEEFAEEEFMDIQETPTTSGPPVSSNGPPVSQPNSVITVQQVTQGESEQRSQGPQVPSAGLPAGWTMEQWQYYGQQYLDGKQ